MAADDYYELLGVSRDADADELKRAYRKKAMQYHPDRNPGDSEAEKNFKQVGEAYDVLRDEQKRSAYDRFGHETFTNGGMGNGMNSGMGGGGQHGFSDISDIFEEVFSGFMGGGRARGRSKRNRGEDLRFDLTITLEDAFTGKKEEINFNAEAACDSCNGTGAASPSDIVNCTQCNGIGVVQIQQGFFTLQQECPRCRGKGQEIKRGCNKCRGAGRVKGRRNIRVDIPAGVEDGNRIRIAGEGNHGLEGAEKGDLYVFVNILPHDIFQREEKDVMCVLPISMAKAALGDKLEVPVIDGGKVRVEIPPGTSHGKHFRLRGKGMPALYNRGNRGDMLVEVIIDIPTHLSKKQRELLEKFDAETKPSSEHRNFWSKVSHFWQHHEKDK
ncbi:MAG: molecular chaperone DnaJ [Alphaproteobacteria bacterium]|nr:molecular chaperone DnaJ [Alphaproteobacteria bacterium]